MRLAIVSCAHGREWLTALWADHLRAIYYANPTFTVSVAVTDGQWDNFRAVTRAGWGAIFYPNDQLGAKHNAALEVAGEADAYMILPSDDFVHPEWIRDATSAIGGGVDYVLSTRCALYDHATGRACVHEQRDGGARKFGAGRVFSRRVIEKVGRLWTDGRMGGLDTDSHARVRAAGFLPHFIDTPYIPITDIKTDVNIWGYDSALNRRCQGCEADEVLGHLSEATREALQRERPS